LVGHCSQPVVTSLEYVLTLQVHFRLLSEPCGTEVFEGHGQSNSSVQARNVSLFFILEQVFAGQSFTCRTTRHSIVEITTLRRLLGVLLLNRACIAKYLGVLWLQKLKDMRRDWGASINVSR
jgi:hypothetical protein